jgi:hypothetical protein
MQLVFQFPIIDLRQVTQPAETIPVWPSADMSSAQVDEFMGRSPFIRNFGQVTSSAEGYSCNINCVKFTGVQDKGFSAGEQVSPVFNCHKRLFSQSIYTSAAEIGFSDKLEALVTSKQTVEPVHMTDILKHYTGISLYVEDIGPVEGGIVDATGAKGWRPVTIADMGSALATNYCHATTIKDAPVNVEAVVNGDVCIALTYAADKILLPANAEKLDQFDVAGRSVQVFGYKGTFEESSYKVWLFRLPDLESLYEPSMVSELQKRRANLFRLNAEKETLRLLVNHFNPANADAALKNYIKKTPIKIFRKERFSTPQNNVRNFALQSEEQKVQFVTLEDLKKILDEYGLANLKNMEQGMKTALKKKSILFITSNPTDTNPIDFGEQFKKISESLQSGSDRDYFTLLNIESGVERDKVLEILYTKMPDYLHITLHASEIKGLYFQNNAKKPDPMPAEEFADYLKQLTELKKPEAVILCACNSLNHAQAVRQYCNYAMGTNYVFPDDAAIVYSKKFYTALFNGKQVRFCHDVAIQGIKYWKPPFEAIDDNEVYNIPQLIFDNTQS